MGLILNLETSSTNCSVSVAKNGELLVLKEFNSANFSHAEKLHVFIEEVLKQANINLSELDAIAVSKGPGSYTGLRIGVSAAKGLCFALEIPLISISTLKSMATQIESVEENSIIIPVLDARRMEVYSAVFDRRYKQLRETKAEIIDESSFNEYRGIVQVHFLGSGAEKIQQTLKKSNFKFHLDIVPSAKEIATLSHKKYIKKNFEDVAYFEPFYLKDFVLQPKKK